MHRHDFFFILAVRQGSGLHEIDFVKHVITSGTIFFLRPGQVHQIEMKANCSGLLVEFDSAFYNPTGDAGIRIRKAGSRDVCAFGLERFKKLSSILSNMYSEFAAREDGYVEAIKAHLDLFFIEYVRQSKSPGRGNSGAGAYPRERFEELLMLLNEHITSVKSVSQYAEMLHVSVYQLNAVTKTAVGKTASELIDEHIVLEAKRYLLGTANQVKDIAYHLGYEDVSYFIRYFKKQTNYTPEAFRQNFK